jgi:hypothetical protein
LLKGVVLTGLAGAGAFVFFEEAGEVVFIAEVELLGALPDAQSQFADDVSLIPVPDAFAVAVEDKKEALSCIVFS